MFTGLIETTGIIRTIGRKGDYRLLTISPRVVLDHLRMGDSVSCDGACLTIVAVSNDNFTVEVSPETLTRTIATGYTPSTEIHLERAAKLGDRLGGHLVSGHIDETGVVESLGRIGESLVLAVSFDKKFDNLVIEKGSIAINGVSLTVNKVQAGQLEVNLIPHTIESTTFARLKPGQRVNLEFDLVGKYILKAAGAAARKGITIEILEKSGW